MSSVRYSNTLYVSGEQAELEAALVGLSSAARRAKPTDRRPPVEPQLDEWSLARCGPRSLFVQFDSLDSDAEDWTLQFAHRHPGLRFDLIEVEGSYLPFPEGLRFLGSRRLRGVPLLIPADRPVDWGSVTAAIEAFDPGHSDLVDGSWDVLIAPPLGLVPGDAEMLTDVETMHALGEAISRDVEVIRAALTAAESEEVEGPEGRFRLALLAMQVYEPRPGVVTTPDEIQFAWGLEWMKRSRHRSRGY